MTSFILCLQWDRPPTIWRWHQYPVYATCQRQCCYSGFDFLSQHWILGTIFLNVTSIPAEHRHLKETCWHTKTETAGIICLHCVETHSIKL